MTIKERRTPPKVLKEVCLRAGGRWEDGVCKGGHCEDCGASRGLDFSHTKHRKMGGTTDKKIHSARNIKRRCRKCHDKLDNHASARSGPVDRPALLSGCHGTGTSYSKAMQTGRK